MPLSLPRYYRQTAQARQGGSGRLADRSTRELGLHSGECMIPVSHLSGLSGTLPEQSRLSKPKRPIPPAVMSGCVSLDELRTVWTWQGIEVYWDLH